MNKIINLLGGKKVAAAFLGLATALAGTAGFALMQAHASISVVTGPTSAITSPLNLPASSAQTQVFSFSLNATAGETLSGVTVEVDKANASTTVSGSDFASLSIYKDDGSNVFNPTAGNLVGAQSTVNVGAMTTIAPATSTPATGKFYVSLATSASWSGTSPVDAVTVSFPSDGITTSANSPTVSPVITSMISAAPTTAATVSTSIKNSGGSVITSANTSAIVHDSATVSGSGPVPTGSVNFSFYNNINCTSTAVASSGALALVSGSVDATGFTQGPLANGSYSFNASYSGDVNYPSGTSACEPLSIVSPSAPAITTHLSSTAVQVNTAVHDSATLSNVTANASGSVTYNVYAGSQCSGSPLFTNTQTVTNGSVPNSADFATATAGTYNWQASYSGDANNASAVSACGSETVNVTVTPPPTTCSNGLVNGSIYLKLGAQDSVLVPFGQRKINSQDKQLFIAQDCVLVPFVTPVPKPPKHCDSDNNDEDDEGCSATSTPPVSPVSHGGFHISLPNIFGHGNKGNKNDK